MVLFAQLILGVLKSLVKIMFGRVTLAVSFFMDLSNLTNGIGSLFVGL